MPSFVVLGQTATASDAFSLDDLAGSSGRLDVLVRCVRAALLCSHGVRRDVAVYLVLLGGPEAPRAVRIAGADAKFIRPDERPLATLLKKALASSAADAPAGVFVPQRHGVAVARGGLDAVLADLGPTRRFVLEEGAADIRDVDDAPLTGDPAFFLGDHLGLDAAARAELMDDAEAQTISVGPLSLHTDDVIAIVSNELDRRRSRR